jgi:hypothetical protein
VHACECENECEVVVVDGNDDGSQVTTIERVAGLVICLSIAMTRPWHLPLHLLLPLSLSLSCSSGLFSSLPSSLFPSPRSAFSLSLIAGGVDAIVVVGDGDDFFHEVALRRRAISNGTTR